MQFDHRQGDVTGGGSNELLGFSPASSLLAVMPRGRLHRQFTAAFRRRSPASAPVPP